MSITRRQFLTAAAAGAGLTILGVRPRSGRADGTIRAKRVLILNFPGGIRSHAAFYALPKGAHNPWDRLPAPSGVVRLGNIFFDPIGMAAVSHASTWPGVAQIPDLTVAAQRFSLIGAVQHAPGGFRQGDHGDDGLRMATGWYGKDTAPGLLTVLNKYFNRDPGKPPAAPVAMIDASEFGRAKGDWAGHAPTPLINYQLPATLPPNGSASVGLPVEDSLDDRLLARTRGANHLTAFNYRAVKQALRLYSPVLIKPELHFNASLTASLGGVTNRNLLEAMGDPISGAPDFACWNAALAVQLLQMGSPAIAVNIGGELDAHSGENKKAPLHYPRFGQILAGIHFALSNTPDPDGAPLIDSTLVVTASEFGRTAKGHPSGFVAGGDGSEHWVWDQPHLIFGAGIKPKLLAPIDDDGNRVGNQFYSTQALLSTVCWAVGMPSDMVDGDKGLWPANTPLHPERMPIGELWS